MPTNPVRTDSGHRAAHVFSDLPGEKGHDELIAFGRQIGLPPFFVQKQGTPEEHYDVWGKKLTEAVRHADREVGMRGMVHIIREKRQAQTD